MSQTITSTLANYAAATSLDAIPKPVIERAKKVIFDELACAYFGRRSAAGTLAARYVSALGGPAEAQIIGTDLRAPAAYAAMANGTAGHGEEIDGAHVIGGHPGAAIVHACMAMAERQHVTGAELINAVVLAYDVGVRVVRACGGNYAVRERLHLTSDSFYTFGATAAATRLLGLDAQRHMHAFALASFQANGLSALFAEDRHISKSFCNGQFAYAGISAAIMSSMGLEGNADIFGHKHGVLGAWGEVDGAAALTQGLGSEFDILGSNFKFTNAGYPIHTPLEAAMLLLEEHDLPVERIDRIDIGMAEHTRRVVDGPRMHNICVQDMVAASVTRGGLAIGDQLFPAILQDDRFKRVRERIFVNTDPEIQQELPTGRAARVTIVVDGQNYVRRVDYPRGHSKRGDVSWADLLGKWLGNLPNCDVETAWVLAQSLEDVGDINQFSSAFAGIMH